MVPGFSFTDKECGVVNYGFNNESLQLYNLQGMILTSFSKKLKADG